MPFPKGPTTVHGGCNCGAVRYRIDVPAVEQCILHPTWPHADDPEALRFPFIATCHCNDCRAATAGIIGAWICAPASTVSVSALARDSAEAQEARSRTFDGKTFADATGADDAEATGKIRGNDGPESESQQWRPAMDMLVPTEHSRGTFLRFYHSSDARTRTFCGRCGTPLSYNVWPMVAGLPDIVDVVLATVDRDDLKTLEPDAQLWWHYGIDWVRKMSGGIAAPKYADWRVEKPVEGLLSDPAKRTDGPRKA